jgi:hypothetical protein
MTVVLEKPCPYCKKVQRVVIEPNSRLVKCTVCDNTFDPLNMKTHLDLGSLGIHKGRTGLGKFD